MANVEKLKQALVAYTGDNETLNQFTAVATEELGENWIETIFDVLSDLSGEEREKLNHAFQYYAAIAAWDEAQSYLAQTEPLDKTILEERVPVLAHWLVFFQDAGNELVEQLKNKLTALPEQETSSVMEENVIQDTPAIASESEQEIPVQPEVNEKLFLVDKIKKEIEIMQYIQAWVSARCVELGNKEVFHYPHYGLVVDLMKQTRMDIQSLLDSEENLTEAERVYPGEVKRLQDYQISLDKDIEIAMANGTSAETDLIQENLTAEDVKKVLGAIDTSTTPEFSGPAPDGFEPIIDSEEELDEQPIKEEYSQIENVVLSEQQKNVEMQKKTSQMPQNSVKKKLSFSLGKKTTGV